MPRAVVPVLLFLLVLFAGLGPSPAQAEPTQFCRAMTTILLAPTDIVTAPVVAARDEWYGLTEMGDPLYMQMIGALPGYVFLTGMQLGGAVLRVCAGAFELPMGIINLFRDESPGPLFKSQDETWALYSEDWGPCPIRIGSSYNTINEF